jgi:hypothetical protein
LFNYFLNYGKVPSRLTLKQRYELLSKIDVEEVFTFLSERCRAPSTSPQLRTYAQKIWTALTEEIGNVFGRYKANKSTRAVYKAFLSKHFRKFDTIVSFNYDTIFEESLPVVRKARYLGIRKQKGSIPVLKPHGSVNWRVGNDRLITVDTSPGSAVVVAPTHLKFVSGPQVTDILEPGYLDQLTEVRDIWGEMEREMRQARVLVFIGYSFPVADLYFASVLRTVLADRDQPPEIVIVNPDAVAIAERLYRRFPLGKVERFFDITQFVQSPRR